MIYLDARYIFQAISPCIIQTLFHGTKFIILKFQKKNEKIQRKKQKLTICLKGGVHPYAYLPIVVVLVQSSH